MNALALRCGLCDVTIGEASWPEHLESELHQSNMPKMPEPVKDVVVPVRVVSAEERKQNKRKHKIAKAESLGYYSRANGRSYVCMRCECGEESDVFVWRRCKRCSNCGKLLHTWLSFSRKPAGV